MHPFTRFNWLKKVWQAYVSIYRIFRRSQHHPTTASYELACQSRIWGMQEQYFLPLSRYHVSIRFTCLYLPFQHLYCRFLVLNNLYCFLLLFYFHLLVHKALLYNHSTGELPDQLTVLCRAFNSFRFSSMLKFSQCIHSTTFFAYHSAPTLFSSKIKNI